MLSFLYSDTMILILSTQVELTMNRYAFIISDGTGITAENFAHSLMTQFERTQFNKITIPYVDSQEKAQQVVERINKNARDHGIKPLVFVTLVNPEVRDIINEADARIFDLFNTFIGPMEEELQEKSSYRVGKSHGVANTESYYRRIEAVDFALIHDDGLKLRGYEKADVILTGVSRCGKTPTCIYLALQYGLMAANYPFTDDDIKGFKLPESLGHFKKKLFGLTIDPERLVQIRSERLPNSKYASLEQCRFEVSEVEEMYRREKIPFLNTTKYSIEEIATKILSATELQRRI